MAAGRVSGMQIDDFEQIRYEVADRILTITLSRPDRLNAYTPRMAEELIAAFGHAGEDDEVRAVIMTGEGRGFCAGADLQGGGDTFDWREREREEGSDTPRDGGGRVALSIFACSKPVIAAVNGPAAGAGFSLALACDTRIASEAAFFACAYGRIGASPDGGMTYFLPRVVGPSRALEILLNDPNMSASDALAERLVAEVVAPDELMDRARAKAEKLAAKAPHYVRMAKLLCGQSIENNLAQHLQLERHGIADSMATEDLRAGVEAFFAGETPEFSGR